MKALVIGSTGFIGRHLVKRLIDDGWNVTGTSRSPSKYFIGKSRYKHFILDVAKKRDFKNIAEKFDCVFNVSVYIPSNRDLALEKQECLTVNSIGTDNILHFVVESQIAFFVHSSSASVYGFPKRIPVKEDDNLLPDNVYGVSKLAGEKLCDKYLRLHNLSIAILRYPSVYGKGCKQNTVLPIFVNKALNNEEIILNGDGSRSQDFVYVDDVISANVLAAGKKKTGIFNIGSGHSTTMVELAEKIIKITKSKSKIIFDRNKQENDFHKLLDISRSKNELGYIPRFDLEAGLVNYIQSL